MKEKIEILNKFLSKNFVNITDMRYIFHKIITHIQTIFIDFRLESLYLSIFIFLWKLYSISQNVEKMKWNMKKMGQKINS